MKILDHTSISFPHPSEAHPSGVLAIGGDLSYERLLLAYQYGIFPWYNPQDPIMWWYPDPRFVLFTDEVNIAKSMRPYFNQERYTVTFDLDFVGVMTACKSVRRKGQDEGTWISDDIIEAFSVLYENGYAHSVEVRNEGKLVGGMYGVSLGKIFFGESMFSQEKNASKYGLITLSYILRKKGFPFIDCQVANDHLRSMGGVDIRRDEFLGYIRGNMEEETLKGSWTSFTDGLDYKDILNDRV